MAKSPFDLQDFMKAFDPEAMNKIFDPQNMMAMLQQQNMGAADMPKMFEANKGRIEAMVEANKVAALSYKDMLEKQMQIFRDVTSDAADQAKSGTSQDVTVAYQQAVERALEIMTNLSEAARDANNQAYAEIKTQVEKAISDLKS